MRPLLPPAFPVPLLLVLGLSLLTAVCAAPDPLLRPPVFQNGKRYLVRYEQTATLTRESGPETIRFLMDVDIRCERKGLAISQQIVTSRFSRVKLEMGSPAAGLRYDSADPATEKSPLAPLFRTLLEGSYVTTLARDGSLKSAEVNGGLLEGNPLVETVGERNMRELLEAVANPGIPAAGVSPGESWDMEFNQELDEVGTVSGLYRVRYEGNELVDGKPHAVLAWTGDLKALLRTRGAEADPRTPVETKSRELKGRMLIDRTIGFPVSGERTIQLTMTLPDPVVKGRTRTIPVRHETTFQLLSVDSL